MISEGIFSSLVSDRLCLVTFLMLLAVPLVSMSYANRTNNLMELYGSRDHVFETCSRDTSFVSAYTWRLESLGLIASMETRYYVLAELLGDAASRETSANC